MLSCFPKWLIHITLLEVYTSPSGSASLVSLGVLLLHFLLVTFYFTKSWYLFIIYISILFLNIIYCGFLYVLVTFWSQRHNTQLPQFKKGVVYFGLQSVRVSVHSFCQFLGRTEDMVKRYGRRETAHGTRAGRRERSREKGVRYILPGHTPRDPLPPIRSDFPISHFATKSSVNQSTYAYTHP